MCDLPDMAIDLGARAMLRQHGSERVCQIAHTRAHAARCDRLEGGMPKTGQEQQHTEWRKVWSTRQMLGHESLESGSPGKWHHHGIAIVTATVRSFARREARGDAQHR
jgi:hypothetical protein